MTGKRVLVCGGRGYTDAGRVFFILDRIDDETPISTIIEGGQRTRDGKDGPIIGGADYWARCWALDAGVEHLQFDADWRAHGKAAGPIRNGQMILDGRPDLVVALPGGRGTADMVRRARSAGIEVVEVR